MDRVSRTLLAQLTGGTTEPGTRLAPVGELAARLGVRQSIVRAAIDALVGAGHLVRGRDDATYVARYRGGVVSRAQPLTAQRP